MPVCPSVQAARLPLGTLHSVSVRPAIDVSRIWAIHYAARKTELRSGKKNLGLWDDFEWGMIHGKLSARRWVRGDDWDRLDT